MNSKVFVETTGLSYHITLQKIRRLMLCARVTASERWARCVTMVVAPQVMKPGAH
jgi:hypothetical protein